MRAAGYLAAMLIYNVTSKVDHSVHSAWLRWMERAYLPAMMESGTMESYQLTRLLDVDDSDGPTYALLITFANRPAFRVYRDKFLTDHKKAVKNKWGDGVLSFASTLDGVLKG